jgi:invasion protein IalB
MSCMIPRCFATLLPFALVTTAAAEDASVRALTYSPWIKYCFQDTCAIGREGRSNPNCGAVISAALIEQSGTATKSLRVTLPTWVSLDHPVGIAIDQGQPIKRPFTQCFSSGCLAEYEAGAELVDQLKIGRTLALEATDKTNTTINLTVPLADFANAYDGPSQKTEVYEKSATELQAELEDREARCGRV